MAPQAVEQFEQLTTAGWADITSVFLDLYVSKTPVEIQAIRLTNEIAGVGIRAFYENLVPGRSEAEIASAVESTIQNQMAVREDVWFARAWAMVQSGPNAAYGGRFNLSTGRRLKAGELVMMELPVCVNGYWSDLTRTGSTGNLPAERREIYEAVREAQELAVKTLAPGVLASQVDRAARDSIAKSGFGKYFQHATGHQVGFRYHDPGDPLAPGVDVALRSGMVVTVEPGIYGEDLGAGCRIEDNVLVTEAGPIILSKASRALEGG